MDYIDIFVNERAKEGKLYLADVLDFLKSRYGIPRRTFFWYVSEELLPKPTPESRLSYYPIESAIEVLEKARLIKELKAYSIIKFSTIKDIFKRYKNQAPGLIDKLTDAIEHYPALVRGRIPDEPAFEWDNAEIIKRFCEGLKKADELENVSIVEIEREVLGG